MRVIFDPDRSPELDLEIEYLTLQELAQAVGKRLKYSARDRAIIVTKKEKR